MRILRKLELCLAEAAEYLYLQDILGAKKSIQKYLSIIELSDKDKILAENNMHDVERELIYTDPERILLQCLSDEVDSLKVYTLCLVLISKLPPINYNISVPLPDIAYVYENLLFDAKAFCNKKDYDNLINCLSEYIRHAKEPFEKVRHTPSYYQYKEMVQKELHKLSVDKWIIQSLCHGSINPISYSIIEEIIAKLKNEYSATEKREFQNNILTYEVQYYIQNLIRPERYFDKYLSYFMNSFTESDPTIVVDNSAKYYLITGLNFIFGSDENFTQAYEYFLKAAELNDIHARILSGLMLFWGLGVIRNRDKGLEYLNKAAKSFDYNVDAYFALGLVYFLSDDTEDNYRSAFFWLSKAMDRGNMDATYLIGLMYQKGAGIEKDEELAISCFKKASFVGHEFGIKSLHEIFGHTTDKVKQDALDGDCYSQFYLGSISYDNKDYCNAVKWLLMAHSQLHGGASKLLAIMYKQKIPNLDFKPYTLLASLSVLDSKYNDEFSQCFLADLHIYPDIFERNDFDIARGLYEKATYHGNINALNNVGILLFFIGFGSKHEPNKSIYYFRRAAVYGDYQAMEKLSYVYSAGYDSLSSNEWKRKSIILKDIQSHLQLSLIPEKKIQFAKLTVQGMS